MPNRAMRPPVPPSSGASIARRLRGGSAWRNGMHAEQAACDALQARGWTLLGRRMRTEAGEIDIVAARGAMLAFVEVKARATLNAAACCTTARQRSRLRTAAEILLARHADWTRDEIRFDLLLVDRSGTIRRIADAFREEGGGQAS